MADWEETFTSWAAGPGQTEQTGAENAERAVKKAIATDEKLSVMDIRVFPHGSYKNRTNVRQVSCLIESLVWNVPNEGFGHSTLTADVRYALAHLFNNTRSDKDCSEWGEVNELKYLFRPGQPWTRQQAHEFVGTAWNCLGFE